MEVESNPKITMTKKVKVRPQSGWLTPLKLLLKIKAPQGLLSPLGYPPPQTHLISLLHRPQPLLAVLFTNTPLTQQPNNATSGLAPPPSSMHCAMGVTALPRGLEFLGRWPLDMDASSLVTK